MKYLIKISILCLLILTVSIVCGHKKSVTNDGLNAGFSGIYCMKALNIEMTIAQAGSNVTFSFQTDVGAINGAGTITGDTLKMTSAAAGGQIFAILLDFSWDRKSFSGTYQTKDTSGAVTAAGVLQGDKGQCPKYDIEANGIPKLVEKDFTQLSKIGKISKFRSGMGHDYSDRFETCRSMKHYYSAKEIYRKNNTIEIYSPVAGSINSVSNDGHGASIGLNNKQIQIKPNDQPAFIFRLFHCDLVSSAIVTGKTVQAGELLGYGRLYYDDLGEYSDSFDIAVWVNTPSGMRLISYFETMKDAVFNAYISRGALSRQDFIISKEARDADPLECNGESFVNGGHLENLFILN
jgi:hypothetical protein